MKHFSIADLDRQAEIDMEAFYKRSGFRIMPETARSYVKTPVALIRALRVAANGPMRVDAYAQAAGYLSAESAQSMIQRLVKSGFITAQAPKSNALRIITITPAGREWLAQNGGAQ